MKKKVVVSVVLIGLMIVLQVLAGSLEPSAGPGSTMKTLDEVEPRIPIPGSDTPVGPFNITKSGSYYLTGDRIASAGGIVVLNNNVTIDLAGFTLIGSNSGSYSGISLGMGGGGNVEIRNGTVRNFAGSGIYEFHIAGENHRVIDVRVINNGSNGIYLNGHGHLVKDCTISGNGTSSASIVYGIYTGSGCTMTGNSVHDNGYRAKNNVGGIWTDKGCIVTGNLVYGNGKSATCDRVDAMYIGSGSTVAGNTSYDNGTSATVGWYVTGIYANYGCTVTGNTSRDNGDSAKGDGITYGIVADTGCTVTGNSSYGNGTSAAAGAYGIFLGGYNLVDQNTAYNNNGINMNLGVTSCVYGINVAP